MRLRPPGPPPPDWAAADRPNYMQGYGGRLRSLGYSVAPIMPGTKKPGRYDRDRGWVDMTDWARYLDHPATHYEVAAWSSWPGCGVGVLTGASKSGAGIIAIDIDILDHEIASAARMAIEQLLGKTPLIRVGKAPKVLLVYRVTERFRKIDRKPIEVLADGQQFLAFATHPDTNQPYTWPKESLHAVALDTIPLVTEAQVREAVEAALEHVPDEMKPIRLAASDGVAVGRSSAGQLGTDEAISDAFNYIPNPSVSWDDWNRIGMAAWAATAGSDEGLKAFDQWSQQSPKYDAKETAARWRHYAKSPPTQIGAGSIYDIARRHGWIPPSDVALNPSKRTDGVDISGIMSLGCEVAEPATSREPEPAPIATPAPPPAARAAPAVDVAAFPMEWLQTTSLVGETVRWIVGSALRPHVPFAVGNVLCAFGAIMGRRYELEVYRTRCNLMAVGIAGPGSGKDHSRKQVKALLDAAGLSQLIAGDRFTSGVAMLRVLHEYPSRISHMDEMGLFLQAIAMKNASPHQRDIIKTMLELFSSSGGTYHGQEYASSEQQRVDIVSPNLNIWGTTTPESLIPAMSRAMSSNGTLSRLLLVPAFLDYPDYQRPTMSSTPPAELVSRLKTSWAIAPEAGNLANQQHIPNSAIALITVRMADGVEDMINRLRDVETERGRAKRYVWTRCAEITIKIAMIEAIARDGVAPLITPQIFAMAWKLVEWCLSYGERMLDNDVSENETEAAHKSILARIRESGAKGLTKAQITRITQSLRLRERDEILAALVESGQVALRVEPSPRGPAKKTYVAA